MAVDLQALANAVEDEEGFLRFLQALSSDWIEECEIEKTNPSSPYGPGALGWENRTMDAFLEAAASWGKASINGSECYEKPSNPWCRSAHILLAGKFYE